MIHGKFLGTSSRIFWAGSLLISSLAFADAPIDATTGVAAPGTHERSAGPLNPRGAASGLIDDFDRADGGLGGDWTVQNGNCSIVSNAARCSSAGLATSASADGATTLSIDVAVDGTATTQYAALVQGYGGGTNNLFIKVQNNGTSTEFDNLACYTGNNGDSFGLGFTALDTTFSTARMTITRTNNDVQIDFTNVDGGSQPDQSYLCSGAPAPDGTGAGIGGFAGLASMDNFGSPAGTAVEPLPVPVNSPVAILTMVLLLLVISGWIFRSKF